WTRNGSLAARQPLDAARCPARTLPAAVHRVPVGGAARLPGTVIQSAASVSEPIHEPHATRGGARHERSSNHGAQGWGQSLEPLLFLQYSIRRKSHLQNLALALVAYGQPLQSDVDRHHLFYLVWRQNRCHVYRMCTAPLPRFSRLRCLA